MLVEPDEVHHVHPVLHDDRRPAPRADRPFQKGLVPGTRFGESRAGRVEFRRQALRRFAVAVAGGPPLGELMPPLPVPEIHQGRVHARPLSAVADPVAPPPRRRNIDLAQRLDDPANRRGHVEERGRRRRRGASGAGHRGNTGCQKRQEQRA